MEYKYQFTNQKEYEEIYHTHKDKKLILTEFTPGGNFLHYTDEVDETAVKMNQMQLQIQQQEKAIAELTELMTFSMMGM